MANQDHVAALRSGVDKWNRWRRANPSVTPDLRGVDLGNLDLRGADLCKADLTDARLESARLVGAFYCGATRWPRDFDFVRSGVLPFRTNAEMSLLIRKVIKVVGRSAPILMTQCLLALAVAYTGQGRALVSFGNDRYVTFLMAGNAFVAIIFSRALAAKVSPDQSVDPRSKDRIRWLALQCGSIVVGLVTAFLPAVLLETFLANSCGIPEKVHDDLLLAASHTVELILLPLWFYAAWRARQGASDPKSLLWIILPATSLLSYWITSKFFCTVLVSLLIASCFILTLSVLKGPAPKVASGGTFGRREWLLMVLLGAFGAHVAMGAAGLTSLEVLILVSAFWTALTVAVVACLRRWWKFRLSLFFGAIALLVLGMPSLLREPFRPHEIRAFRAQPPARPSLSDYTLRWLRTRLKPSHTEEAPYTVVLVAAAGGGIRSAFWTARLLGFVQDKRPNFGKHLFAISSVSGGSVGSAVFAALLKADCGGHCEASARRILRGDFLAPALGSLLTADLISANRYSQIPDRAVALEWAFERAWRDKMGTRTMEESLDQLWSGDDNLARPSLFFNSTEAKSATRVVFSNISMAGVPGLDSNIEDSAQKLPLSLSTAMLLSGRFPYISPEGLAGQYRFVDGGYFDNSGAATLLNIVDAIRDACERLHAEKRVQIAVLVIENEPIEAGTCDPTGGALTPLEILDELRQRRAREFLDSLRHRLTDREKKLFLDQLRPADMTDTTEFNLGWTQPLWTDVAMGVDAPSVLTVLHNLGGLLD